MQAEWFEHPEWWFAGDTYDRVITDKFGHLLDTPFEISHDSPIDAVIDYILINDQLPRHVFRNGPNAHVIAYFLQKALEASRSFSNTRDLAALSTPQFCFALLPRRHTNEASEIYEVIRLTWERLEHPSTNTSRDMDMLKRFLKASYARCPPTPPCLTTALDIMTSDILDFNPTSPPQQPSKRHLHYLTGPYTTQTRHIIVSLSGGVDSMLCSWLLRHKYPNTPMSAVHINYANRDTSDAEAAFVASWCNTLNISCYIRRISEIQRRPCMKHNMRETYETYTKDVRFNAYKHVIALHHTQSSYVVLGHNKDDTLENIFTNLAGRAKYENLDGMEVISNSAGIDFWRPLLQTTKQDIIQACKDLNIPFLPNSTPPWSMRGQIRNKIVPCIDSWNPEFCPSLHALSDTLRDLYSILDGVVDAALSTKASENKIDTIHINTLPTSHAFWSRLFTRLGQSHISQKSLENFQERIADITTPKAKIVLSKQLTVVISHCEHDGEKNSNGYTIAFIKT